MPAVNSKIVTADYNDIRNKVVSVLGAGSGNFGWGQDSRINSSAVAEGNRVTVNEWTNLRFDIINAYRHVYGTNPTMSTPVAGNTIRYSSTFIPDTGAQDVPQKQYDDWINNVIANRFTVAAGESATTSVISNSSTENWSSQRTCVIGFNFANANEARYFFNSGGRIRVSSARSGGDSTAQNSSWTSLLSAAGTITFGGNNPGTGTTPLDGTNWYRCTNSFQTFYTATASSPYGANTWTLQARVVDVATNNTGTAALGEIRSIWTDGYVDPGIAPIAPPGATQTATPANFPPDDIVNGTLSISANLLYATGIMVPNSTVFTVSLPTLGVGAISGS
jgi:hypothetical protein